MVEPIGERALWPNLPRGSETILLVEDDPAVRSMTRNALQMFGYNVLEAAHGEIALQRSQDHVGRIHLLLTDVMMPEINGRQLANLLAPLRPDMKRLFMSGFLEDAEMSEELLVASQAFLQKPFTARTLIVTVRRILDQP